MGRPPPEPASEIICLGPYSYVARVPGFVLLRSTFAGSLGSGSPCLADGNQTQDNALVNQFLPKAERMSKIDRRLSGTLEGTFSTGYSLGMEANFDSIDLTVTGVSYNLWTDGDTASPGNTITFNKCI
jgi:hypothetical protein